MCSHVYKKFVSSPDSKKNVVDFYTSDYSEEFVSEYYDFFQENKDKFDEIFHQNEHDWGKWNELLTEYGSPHSFSQMASTGYSVIFKNLQEGNDDIYVLGFTLSDKEIRKTIGEEDDFALSKNQGGGCHSFSDERKILTWLHNNGKVDASLCMLEDTEQLTLSKECDMRPSEFIMNLLDRKTT